MRKSFTAVVSRNETFTGTFETEPYECAWAGEARWFVRVLRVEGEGARVSLQPQLSPDGLFWCDAEAPPMEPAGEGLFTLSMRDFGGWLRLRGTVEGDGAAFTLVVTLVLKE